MYDEMGGVPAIEEVRFSVTHNRGCFGACNFCSLAFHQGRTISCRSHQSVIREVKALTEHPGFKGYIHDVGGPTANFRHPACAKQRKAGVKGILETPLLKEAAASSYLLGGNRSDQLILRVIRTGNPSLVYAFYRFYSHMLFRDTQKK